MRHLIGVALVTCVVVACGASPRPRSPATTTAVAEPVVAPQDAAAAEADPRAVVGPPAPRCRVTVTDAEGCRPQDVEALIAPVRPRMEHCRGESGGKLRVSVRKGAGDKLAFHVEPGSSLDPTEQECVLDALRSILIDESSTAWAGLNVPPSGFTSLITVEW